MALCHGNLTEKGKETSGYELEKDAYIISERKKKRDTPSKNGFRVSLCEARHCTKAKALQTRLL